MHSHNGHSHGGHSHEKQSVALISMGASAALAVAKFLAALFTGSLGILSEAIHSLIDFGATILTYLALRVSDRPADDQHHYGHAKIESVAALVETGLLFLTTAWICWEAIRRLLGEESHEVEVTWWAVAIIAGSIIIDYNRARALKRVAQKTSSEALEADALHFSSDMWSSAVVLAGLGAVWAGVPAADSIAALMVSAFIAHAGWDLGARTVNTLLDTAPAGATGIVRGLVNDVHGVLALKSIRLRPAGATMFASIVVEVARTMPIDEIVRTKDAITAAVQERFPNADITVTANPVALDSETVFQKVMLIASRRNLAIHHLNAQQIGGRLAISFDLEVDGSMPMGEAHDKATGLEEAIRAELGRDVEVESHIEPQPGRMLQGHDAAMDITGEVSAALLQLAAAHPRLSGVHQVRLRRNEEGLFLHYHCRCSPSDTVEQIHDAIDRVEAALKDRFPGIRRVIAHAEPLGTEPHAL
ncbi:MAG: cation diffusion facilitator family transporter [Aestuariivirga sp.]|uniref:cation diffusion facilitator family transporter n=1 Tax=Aestuariivirga sp. TaxID=2650926 RepID=UPI0025B86BB5|nr:cation diffusion facilitator family transporter [Aestuariivirga sp.]MCA3560974.1 cation diffusion facilitator family transporter [Aestuariivirga sp.]